MKTVYMIALSLIPRIGRKTIQKIYLNNLDIKNNETLLKNIVIDNIQKKDSNASIDDYFKRAHEIIGRSNNENIEIMTILDDTFPDSLKTISDFPVIINIRGDKSCLYHEKTLAIIGTRNPTEHGIKIGYRIGEIAASKNFVVVSGLAIGSDTAGLTGCVESKGRSIAVMPGGLDKVYPKSNTELANKIIDNKGCLISEYYIGKEPNRGNYVERDRLQAALSKGIFVVETSIDGGTMHAVNEGLRIGLVIGCYNHPMNQLEKPQSKGNQLLINEKNAKPLFSEETIEEFFSLISKTESFNNNNNTQFDNSPKQLNIFS